MARLLLALLAAGAAWAAEPDCAPVALDETSLIQSGVVIATGADPAQSLEPDDIAELISTGALRKEAVLMGGEGAGDLAELISTGALRKEAVLMGVMSTQQGRRHVAWVALGVLLCFLLPGVGWIFARCLGSAVKTSIESLDRTVIGVDVEIGKLSINPFKAYIIVEDVVVKNPDGYVAPYLMKIDRVYVDVDASALFRSFGKDIVVDHLIFTGLDTIYAKKMFTSNFNDVMDFMDGDGDVAVATDAGDAKAPTSEEPSGRKITLHRVCVEDVGMKMELEIGGGHGPRVEVGNINYENFSDEVGGNAAMLRTAISLLLRTILKSVVVSATGKHKSSTFSGMSFLKSQEGEGKKRGSWFRNPWASSSQS